jgi:aminopeptidase N
MEYAMATLVNGPGLGTAFHELMHSWYQGVLGTNESLYPWMDEGFASFADTRVMDFYTQSTNEKPQQSAQGTGPRKLRTVDSMMRVNPHQDAYNSYFGLVANGLEEPMTTHADHYKTNYAYSVASYSKGEVFLQQLGYITGAQVRDRILLEYYRLWRFKHPNANDFIRVAEKVSGMKLDWYKRYWVNTTGVIDYGIDSVWEENGKTSIRLKNNGDIPMPVDLQLKFRDGSMELHYIPMNLMFQEKPVEFPQIPRTKHDAWKWVQQTYTIEIKRKPGELASVWIDPSERMADVNRKNNSIEY